MDNNFLKILACPETKRRLKLADASIIEKINSAIDAGTLESRNGQKVAEKIDGGLVAETGGAYLYPIRQEIPVLLIEESIALQPFSAAQP